VGGSEKRARRRTGVAPWIVPCLAAAAALGCSTEYLPVSLTPDGVDVVVSTEPPAPGCTEIGPVEGRHGTQCNAFGRTGTKEGATTVLRNLAGTQGANYVQVDREIEPNPRQDNCLYAIRGRAFRCPTAE
jgi:hypothetical protein